MGGLGHAAQPSAAAGLTTMDVSELDYALPPELIAQSPVDPRDAARLLVYERSHDVRQDRRFSELPGLLRVGDLLVRNDTRVLAARTHFRRATGGRLEVLFLEAHDQGGKGDGGPAWETLVRGRPREGETLTSVADNEWQVRLLERLGDGRWLVRSLAREPVDVLLARHGSPPLPPYIKARLADPERYQTIFAAHAGSAAAPTAGLHFTAGVERQLRTAGVEILDITLHVGLGTFKRLADGPVEGQRLHSEAFALPAGARERIAAAKAAGGRVIAVGTTMVRLLETLARRADEAAEQGRTDLFVYPGFEFVLVDGLITNFHLPRSSLLALVMAFCCVEQTRGLYRHAVEQRYRFYSFGDAMLIL